MMADLSACVYSGSGNVVVAVGMISVELYAFRINDALRPVLKYSVIKEVLCCIKTGKCIYLYLLAVFCCGVTVAFLCKVF